MITLNNINKSKPPLNTTVLIKIHDNISPQYYVCDVVKLIPDYLDLPTGTNEEIEFQEADGENYRRWRVDEVVGWIDINELDKRIIIQ